MLRRFFFIITFSIIAVAPETVFANIIYDESASGDLGQGIQAPILTTALGIDTVSGKVSWTTSIFDIDGFVFTIKSGQTAKNFSFSFSNNLLATNEQVGGNVFLYSGSFSSGLTSLDYTNWIVRAPGSIFGNSSFSPLALFSNISQLNAGIYSISIEPNTRSVNGGMIPYSLSFDVSSVVPVPPSIWLFGTSLLGFLGLKRRMQ